MCPKTKEKDRILKTIMQTVHPSMHQSIHSSFLKMETIPSPPVSWCLPLSAVEQVDSQTRRCWRVIFILFCRVCGLDCGLVGAVGRDCTVCEPWACHSLCRAAVQPPGSGSETGDGVRTADVRLPLPRAPEPTLIGYLGMRDWLLRGRYFRRRARSLCSICMYNPSH